VFVQFRLKDYVGRILKNNGARCACIAARINVERWRRSLIMLSIFVAARQSTTRDLPVTVAPLMPGSESHQMASASSITSLYVISAFKERNPAAAKAIIERL
jgi:hypothetical protein